MTSPASTLCRFWASSIGKKFVVAFTGIILAGFLAGHLTGNLLMYAGPEAFNNYALFLHGVAHGAGVWVARVVLLTSLVLHIVATIQLTTANRAARERQYEKDATVQASRSSLIMIWSGLTILAFVIFHILHFTVQVDATLAGYASEGNPYGMVILGFQNFLVSLFYIIAISLLCSHLSHGVGSVFQTLGWRTRKNATIVDGFAKFYAIAIWIGFISIPIAVLTGFLK